MNGTDHDDEVLTEVAARIAAHDDLAGFLAAVTDACREVLEVDAVGVMVTSRSGRLQLLAASSHQSAELELHQSQIDEGPCVDAAGHGVLVASVGADNLARTWPTFGPAMIRAGFLAVHSAPLLWRDGAIGAMALFRKQAKPFDRTDDEAAQFFADLVTRRVMNDDDPSSFSPPDQAEQVEAALSSRTSIELAKGVMAELEHVEMDEAYRLLIARAGQRGQSLTTTADDLVSGRGFSK